MKIFLCGMLFLLFSIPVCAQSYPAVGKVVDAVTKNPLNGASVFAQNTTIGITTDTSGSFRLRLPNGGYDLVVTFTGYETQSLRISNNSDQTNLVIELKQKDKNMEAVTIQASNEVKDGWTQYGEFFKEHFIGRTLNSAQCTIENPDALRFFFSKRKNKLKVLGKEDIIVKNNALGYTIKYQLDSFVYEYNTKNSFYTGYPFFEAMQGTPQQDSIWKENRQLAYEGSTLHFMRTYYDMALQEDGYMLKLLGKEENSEKGITIKNPYDTNFYRRVNDNVEIQFPQPVLVVYTDEKPEKGYISYYKFPANAATQGTTLKFTPGKKLVIEQNGYYYEQDEVTFIGYWTWEQVGDMLPYDYLPE
jgi:CarboxypepD_reg-like domain